MVVGVAQTGRVTDVAGGQPQGAVAAGIPHSQVTLFGDVGDGPPVAVLHPIGGAQAEPVVVGPGDDHIPDTRPVTTGQSHLGRRRGVIKTICSGTAVEFSNEVPGGGDHDRVEPSRSVGKPSVECIFGGLSEVADLNPAVINVEPE
jgi:hypothetical protein